MNTKSRVEVQYQQWMNDDKIDENTKQELRSIEGQAAEIEDRFYKDLEFGTGGLRGVIGAGTNRMNRYTIGLATQGLAQSLLRDSTCSQAVVIAYDSRHYSPEFALESALVLAGNGILVHLFESLRPTPELSYAVRRLQATAGIVVTASHNPPEYNGFKVYGSDGGQIVTEQATDVMEEIRGLGSFASIKRIAQAEAEAAGLLLWVGKDMDEAYTDAVLAVSPNPQVAQSDAGAALRIVFTPLHGTGNLPVSRVLEQAGFRCVQVVKEQQMPDPNFSTVKSPNPEEREAFTLAMQQAEIIGADIIIGTDPDCDRMGAVVKNDEGEYVVLSGNQSGAIMAYYLLDSLQRKGELPANGVLIKTIVTSEMGAVIAQHYGVEVMNTLTGFKYIAEKMTGFEADGNYQFLFGYEESYGYLAGTYARDKDAVVASLLICEAAAYYKSQGKTLYEVLQELYNQFGYFQEKLESRTLKGKDGIAQIKHIMDHWREHPPALINSNQVVKVLDYAEGLDGLPRENVLKYVMDDDAWFCLRPSGTEPKIKVYFGVCSQSQEQATMRIEELRQAVMAIVDTLAQ